jgi:hypothetical protein
MGALEPVGAAAAFSLLGEGLFALRLIPFLVTSLASAGLLLMVARWMSPRAALPAVLMMLVAFPVPTMLMTQALGGASAGLFCGVVALGASAQVKLTVPGRLSFTTGLFCGLCLYAHPAMMPFAAASLASVFLVLAGVVLRPAFVLVASGHIIRLALGLGLGGLPVWLGNGWRSIFRLETGVAVWQAVPTVEALGAFLTETLGGPAAPWLVGATVVTTVPALVQKMLRHGVEDRGMRLALGGFLTVVVGILNTLFATPVSVQEAALRTVPVVVALPLLAGACACMPAIEAAVVVILGALFLDVAPGAFPPSPEAGADVPVDAAVAFLDAHPGTSCYAAASVAYRVALLSAERHTCVSILGPDYVRAWRAGAAAGPRAYLFSPGEEKRARVLDGDLKRLKLPRVAMVAGPFQVRITDGTPYPPAVPAVVTEHGRRDRRALIDGDVSTGVTARAGQKMSMNLVWPTSLQTVSYWQDVTRLSQAPCRVRALVVLESGREEPGTDVVLNRACDVARRWALWPLASWEVKLPVPAAEAVSVVLETRDEGGVLAATEVRVLPRSRRGARD